MKKEIIIIDLKEAKKHINNLDKLLKDLEKLYPLDFNRLKIK